MVNIPPLLCSTPPPIDFGEEEEEEDCKVGNALALDDDEFEGTSDRKATDNMLNDINFVKLPNDVSYMSQPNVIMETGAFIANITPPPLDEENMDHNSKVKAQVKPIEAINFYVSGIGNTDDEISKPSQEASVSVETNSFSSLNTELIEDANLEMPTVNHKTTQFDVASNIAEQPANVKTNVSQIEILNASINSKQDHKSQLIFNQVSLEDVTEDESSDDDSLPKIKNLVIAENSEDYFAIHLLDKPLATDELEHERAHEHEHIQALSFAPNANELQVSIGLKESATNQVDSNNSSVEEMNFEQFNMPKSDSNQNIDTAEILSNQSSTADFTDDFDADFQEFETKITVYNQLTDDIELTEPSSSNSEIRNDFEEFEEQNSIPEVSDAALTTKEIRVSNIKKEIATSNSHNADDDKKIADLNDNIKEEGFQDDDDDDFDDFQDFTCHTPATAIVPIQQQTDAVETSMHADDNLVDDNDFGDFEEATFTPTSNVTYPTTTTTPIKQHNVTATSSASNDLTLSLSLDLNNIESVVPPVLEMMFPEITRESSTSYTNCDKIPTISTSNFSKLKLTSMTMQLQSIDCARALNYQWTTSNGRYALIKSLGIDSRNILFGEKWSKPIFAADLSSLPLKPINYQTSDVLQPSNVVNATTSASPLAAAAATTTTILASASASITTPISTLSTKATTATTGKAMAAPFIPTTQDDNERCDKLNSIDTNILMHTNYNTPDVINETIFEAANIEYTDMDPQLNLHLQQLNLNAAGTKTSEITVNQMESTITQQEQRIISNIKDITSIPDVYEIDLTMLPKNASTFDYIMDIENKSMPVSFNTKPLPMPMPMPIVHLQDFNLNDAAKTTSSSGSSNISIASNNSPNTTTFMDIYMGNLNNNNNIILPTAVAISTSTSPSPSPSTITGRTTADSVFDAIDDIDEVIVTSTYSGPLKETHIYTPPKTMIKPSTIRVGSPTKTNMNTNINATAAATATSTKLIPIDFDYEMASAGIIIDETVVKKEYRDIEYNPEFDVQTNQTESPTGATVAVGNAEAATSAIPLTQLNSNMPSLPPLFDSLESGANTVPITIQQLPQLAQQAATTLPLENTNAGEWDDDFTEFQSAPLPMTTITHKTKTEFPNNATVTLAGTASVPGTPSRGIILSPAILMPQAIQANAQHQKQNTNIEWGAKVASINPDELARIEAFFSQNKSKNLTTSTVAAAAAATAATSTTKTKDSNSGTTSQKSTPKHATFQMLKSPANSSNSTSFTISAAIANKERRQQQYYGNMNSGDDDDWSEFVYVPATSSTKIQASSTAGVTTGSLTNASYSYKNNGFVGSTNTNLPMSITMPMQMATMLEPSTSIQHNSRNNYNNNNNQIKSNNFNVNNDDEWSDFVSSKPTGSATTTSSAKTELPPTLAPIQTDRISTATSTNSNNATSGAGAGTSTSATTSSNDSAQFSILAQNRSL